MTTHEEGFESLEDKPYDLDYIKHIIDDSPRAMQAELDRTDNSWVACLRTRLANLSLAIDLGMEDKLIDPELGEQMFTKLEELTKELKVVGAMYPKPSEHPREELRKSLMEKLNNICL